MLDKDYSTMRGWLEVFTIFAKYIDADERFNVCAEHDEIWAGPDAEVVTDEDKKRLYELGWTESREGGFRRMV